MTPELDQMTEMTPTRAEGEKIMAAFTPRMGRRYANGRNTDNGPGAHKAVSVLSPYIRRRLVLEQDAVAAAIAAHGAEEAEKFVQEVIWRGYFKGWLERRPQIWDSYRRGLADDLAALERDRRLRRDVERACAGQTGLECFDAWATELVDTGYLHNHARMWLASYLVHLRKVHWHVGASWMLAHLLDGDLASNHLSWQWVAGTGSTKPYLFNADNVARYAPEAWHSPGTVIDTSYETLDAVARSSKTLLGHAPTQHSRLAATEEPALFTAPPAHLGFTAPQPHALVGKDVWLVHPWSLGRRPPGVPADALCISIVVAECHQPTPWSALRWGFVGQRMADMGSSRWFAPAESMCAALAGARCVQLVDDMHLGTFPQQLRALAHRIHPKPLLFEAVDRLCPSFSGWWKRTRIAA